MKPKRAVLGRYYIWKAVATIFPQVWGEAMRPISDLVEVMRWVSEREKMCFNIPNLINYETALHNKSQGSPRDSRICTRPKARCWNDPESRVSAGSRRELKVDQNEIVSGSFFWFGSWDICNFSVSSFSLGVLITKNFGKNLIFICYKTTKNSMQFAHKFIWIPQKICIYHKLTKISTSAVNANFLIWISR